MGASGQQLTLVVAGYRVERFIADLEEGKEKGRSGGEGEGEGRGESCQLVKVKLNHASE